MQKKYKGQAKKPVCSVLITCDAPTADGKMQVEMTYEGDASLAAYLIHGAQAIMDDEFETNMDEMMASNIENIPSSRVEKLPVVSYN